MKLIIIIVLLISYIIVPSTNLHAYDKEASDEILLKIKTIFGSSEKQSWNEDSIINSLETVIIKEDNIPFISNQLTDRKLIKATLKNVSLRTEKIHGIDTSIREGVRNFEIYFDSLTGQLLKIISTKDSYYSKIASGEIRKPSNEKAEIHLGKYERYMGFSKIIPKSSFIEIFKKLPSEPIRADQIIAYIIDIEKNGKRRPVWIVETYGVQSISTGHHPLKIYQLNHIRSIFDMDGNLLVWNNRPYVTE